MVLSPNPRGLVIFGGKIKDSQRPSAARAAFSSSAIDMKGITLETDIFYHHIWLAGLYGP